MHFKIKDIGSVITGITPLTNVNKYYTDKLYPFIGPTDIKNVKYVYVTKKGVSKAAFHDYQSKFIDINSIMVDCIGSDLGNVALTTTKSLTNQQINSITKIKSNIVNYQYLYYLLNMKKEYFQRLGDSGSTVPIVNKTLFENIVINILPLAQQLRITNILGSLDKKIEINQKKIAELEETAKLIYDYWFVQFEFPDENGKPYKSSGGKMVYNETLKRDIPLEWNVGQVKDCIKHINTGLNPRNNFELNKGGKVKYITVKNITKFGTLDFSSCDLITEEVKKIINKRSKLKEGDILFASIAPLGRCYLIYETPYNWEINESVFSIRTNNIISPEYLYMFFMSNHFIRKAEQNSTGSVFSGIRISALENMNIIIPSTHSIENFTKNISAIYSRKFKFEKENQELTYLRDWLLPMLMNGQVTVEE